MIYDNSESDLFFNFYDDDPLGFLTKKKLIQKRQGKRLLPCKKSVMKLSL